MADKTSAPGGVTRRDVLVAGAMATVAAGLPVFASKSAQGASGRTVRLPSAPLQPIATDGVAGALAGVVTTAPANGSIEIAGPERGPLHGLARRYLSATADQREVIARAHARCFGSELGDDSPISLGDARLGTARFEERLRAAVGGK
jgi:uncharacterized protein YbjT (DUF2867 family)